MDKKKALEDINETQDYYVDKLIDIIESKEANFDNLKEIDFTSPTGTGKTVMVAKMINRLSNYFFVITTLSRGQLRVQVGNKIAELSKHHNYIVYGSQEYTKNTKVQENDIIKSLPDEKKIIWIRDEGHIATNRWQEVLRRKAFKIVNFSATNKTSVGIQCNFTHTMMLRTVSQNVGSPSDALNKLVEIKNKHSMVTGYNPCALFRVLHDNILKIVISECEKRGLRYINITNEDFDMTELCSDGNEFDVIINKFKITEGIDLRRCHVIYMDTKPGNESTVVQIIGRARRNALFWRNDIDILSDENEGLLANTRQCFVFYNSEETLLNQSSVGELSFSLCNQISVEDLKPNITVKVKNGQLPNGLLVYELEGKTGDYHITVDENTGFNIVDNDEFYRKIEVDHYGHRLLLFKNLNVKKIYFKSNIKDFFTGVSGYCIDNFDTKRRNFYWDKLVLEAAGINLDFNKWANFLEIDNMEKFIDNAKYRIYRNAVSVDKNIMQDLAIGKIKLSSSEWEKCIDKCYIKLRDIHYGKRSIAQVRWLPDEKSNESFADISFSKDIIPFIEKIEYIDISKRKHIGHELYENMDKVVEVGHDIFIFNHRKPMWGVLHKNLIFSKEEVCDHIYCSSFFLGRSVDDYWFPKLRECDTIYDFDSRDNEVLNLKEVNERLKLGFSDEEINEYLSCDLELKQATDINNIAIAPMFSNYINAKLFPAGTLEIKAAHFNDRYLTYKKIENDKELAIIGPHKFKFYREGYSLDKPITSKITYFCKFNSFISKRYGRELSKLKGQYYRYNHSYGFDRRADSCLGYCVEYYAKMRLYGNEYYDAYITEALKEGKTLEVTPVILVRAAMKIYHDDMVRTFGSGVATLIQGIKIQNLIKDTYKKFVDTVVELGEKTYAFVRYHLYNNCDPDLEKLHDPDLSVNYISALCDFITENTILDLKCTGTINENYMKQVMAYHYLSTKRSDLHITRVIVYDAVADKYIEVMFE